MMVGWWGAAIAGEGAVDVLLGARTAPDAALEQPSEWEPEVEPTVLAALVGRYRSTGAPAWWGVEGSAWGLAPEPDAVLLAVGPRAGIGGDAGPTRLDLAARYDAQAYPFSSEVSNGRAEALAGLAVPQRIAEPEVALVGIDRHYLESTWSFRTAEPSAGLGLHTADGAARVRILGAWQVNQGRAADGTSVVGDQLRGTVEIGGSGGRIDGWVAYRLIVARGGAEESAARPVFTPVGDYSEDADALSAGGFLQHRLALGVAAEGGPWTVRASALGRLRLGEAATVDRTLHGQLDLDREAGEQVSVLASVGASGARVVGGASYLDVYGWLGLSWEP